MIIHDNGCADAVEEIVECNKAMRDTHRRPQRMHFTSLFLGALVDRETGVFTPLDRYLHR